MHCSKCKSIVPDDTKYCSHCGQKQETKELKCSDCGEKYNETYSFCSKCGSTLTNNVCVGVEDKRQSKNDDHNISIIEKSSNKALGLDIFIEIAFTHDLNDLSPLSNINRDEERKGFQINAQKLPSHYIEIITQPEKIFLCTCLIGNRSFEHILLFKDSKFLSWFYEDGIVTLNEEQSPASFIGNVSSILSEGKKGGENEFISLKHKQAIILNAIFSLCEAYRMIGLKNAFTTYKMLRDFIEKDDDLDLSLKILEQEKLISALGSDNYIINLTERGEAILKVINFEESICRLVVANEGNEEFASVMMTQINHHAYMITNPRSGDELIIRVLGEEAIHDLLNWMWAAEMPTKDEKAEFISQHKKIHLDALSASTAQAAVGLEETAGIEDINKGVVTSTTVEWFISVRKENYGPYTWEQLQKFALDGTINSASMVWRKGMPDWVAAGKVEGLF